MPSCYIMKLLQTLGSKVTTTPKSSPTLCRMYLFKLKLNALTFTKDQMKAFQIKIKLIWKPCHPKVISHVYSLGGTNLELPLWWHHLRTIRQWKNSPFVSFCASLSHIVIVCLSFSFCVSLSRAVSVLFIVSQFVILPQNILGLFQFLLVCLQPQHLCQRFWCPHRDRPCSELPRCLFRKPSLHSWFKKKLIQSSFSSYEKTHLWLNVVICWNYFAAILKTMKTYISSTDSTVVWPLKQLFVNMFIKQFIIIQQTMPKYSWILC